MGRNKKFKSLLTIQVMALMLFLVSFYGKQSERELFDGVSEFIPVNAKVIDSDRVSYRYYSSKGRRRSRSGYNNTYQYEVNGQKYVVTLYESYSGTNKILYYNPNNPQICSEYRSYDEAKRHYSMFTNIGLILQGIVILFALKSLGVGKGKAVVQQPTGVVLNDDYDFYMNSENGQSDDMQRDSKLFAGNKDSTQIDSIPFVRRQEMTEVDSIPFVRKQEIERQDSVPFVRKHETMQGNSIPFVRSETSTKSELISSDKVSTSEGQTYVLYTEEEYKNRK